MSRTKFRKILTARATASCRVLTGVSPLYSLLREALIQSAGSRRRSPSKRFCLTSRPRRVMLRRSMKSPSGSRKSENDSSRPKLVIKKYSDRRLYDSSTSRYVKLDDVARMVRDGVEVKVVDARSGKDLTYVTLTQIILEDAREQQIPLPLQFLQQLVRASDKATHEFLSWYLSSTLDLYQKVQGTVRTRLPEAKGVVARPIEFVRNLLAGHAWPPPTPASDNAEVEQLRRRVAELEARLGGRDKPAGRRHKAPQST